MHINRTIKNYQNANNFSQGSDITHDFYSLAFANLYFPRTCLHNLYYFHNGKVNFLIK